MWSNQTFFPVSPAQNLNGGRCEFCLWKCGEFQDITKLSFRQKTTLNIVLANSVSNCGQSTYALPNCLKRGKENNFFFDRGKMQRELEEVKDKLSKRVEDIAKKDRDIKEIDKKRREE